MQNSLLPRLPHHPVEIVEQVTTLILMEEQINENIFRGMKLLIWTKMSKFLQVNILSFKLNMD